MRGNHNRVLLKSSTCEANALAKLTKAAVIWICNNTPQQFWWLGTRGYLTNAGKIVHRTCKTQTVGITYTSTTADTFAFIICKHLQVLEDYLFGSTDDSVGNGHSGTTNKQALWNSEQTAWHVSFSNFNILTIPSINNLTMKRVLRTCPQTSVARMTASSSKQAVIWLSNSHHNHLNGPAHHFFHIWLRHQHNAFITPADSISLSQHKLKYPTKFHTLHTNPLKFFLSCFWTSVAQQKGKLTKAGCDLIRATMSQPLWRARSLCKTVATTHLLN